MWLTIPFMSKYKQSISKPLGFGPDVSMGTSTETPSRSSIRAASSSRTWETVKRNKTSEQHDETPLTDFRILLAEPTEKSRDTLSIDVSILIIFHG